MVFDSHRQMANQTGHHQHRWKANNQSKYEIAEKPGKQARHERNGKADIEDEPVRQVDKKGGQRPPDGGLAQGIEQLHSYPLMPVETMLLMMYFCSSKKTTSTGTTAIVSAAAIG